MPDPKSIDERDVQLAGQIAAIQVLLEVYSKTLDRIENRLTSIEAKLPSLVLKSECEKNHKPLMQHFTTWGRFVLIIAAIVMGYMKLHGMELKQPTVVATPIPPQTIVVKHEYPMQPDAGVRPQPHKSRR